MSRNLGVRRRSSSRAFHIHPGARLDVHADQHSIAEVLTELRMLLVRVPDSALARPIRGRLMSYEQTFARWCAIQPTSHQRAAMLECLIELRTQVGALDDSDLPVVTRHRG